MPLPRRSSKSGKTSRILRPAKPARGTAANLERNATPLDRKQQALREKEEQLRAATEQLQQLIEDAPRRREEQARRRREELAGDTRLSSRTALIDKRYNVSTTADSSLGKRRLRSEKRDGKLFFIFLCVVLGGLIVWIYQLVLSQLQRF